jgi:hypothetical protein
VPRARAALTCAASVLVTARGSAQRSCLGMERPSKRLSLRSGRRQRHRVAGAGRCPAPRGAARRQQGAAGPCCAAALPAGALRERWFARPAPAGLPADPPVPQHGARGPWARPREAAASRIAPARTRAPAALLTACHGTRPHRFDSGVLQRPRRCGKRARRVRGPARGAVALRWSLASGAARRWGVLVRCACFMPPIGPAGCGATCPRLIVAGFLVSGTRGRPARRSKVSSRQQQQHQTPTPARPPPPPRESYCQVPQPLSRVARARRPLIHGSPRALGPPRDPASRQPRRAPRRPASQHDEMALVRLSRSIAGLQQLSQLRLVSHSSAPLAGSAPQGPDAGASTSGSSGEAEGISKSEWTEVGAAGRTARRARDQRASAARSPPPPPPPRPERPERT